MGKEGNDWMSNGKEFQRMKQETGNKRRQTADRQNGETWSSCATMTGVGNMNWLTQVCWSELGDHTLPYKTWSGETPNWCTWHGMTVLIHVTEMNGKDELSNVLVTGSAKI